MYDDVPAPEDGRRIFLVTGTRFVVVNDSSAVVQVPNLYAELVTLATTEQSTVDGGEHEAIFTRPIERPDALELGTGARDNKPVVARRVEIEIAGLEFDLCLAGRDRGPLLVLGDEAEVRPPNQRIISGVGTGW